MTDRRLPRMLCLLGIVATLCGEALAQGGKVIVLQNADSLVGRTIDGQEARELIGHVSILQGDVHITCDSAMQFIQSGRFDLMGHVVLNDDSVTIRAPRGRYHRDQRIAEGFGGVELEDRTSTLTAREGIYEVGPRIARFFRQVAVRDSVSIVTGDSLIYYRNERRSIATGRVTVRSDRDNITITGEHLEHDAPRSYSRMTGDPLLIQIDTSARGADTLLVRSVVMESFRDSTRLFVATDSVRILRADLAGVCGKAAFFTAADSILLRRDPVVWYQETQLTGDSINVYLKRRALFRVVVGGSAFALSRSDSLFPDRFDQLTGESLTMEFADKVLRRIDVETRATSVYHLYEDSLGNGLNRTSGDRIVMDFAEGKIHTIHVFGGVEGRYVPENLVRLGEREYQLPGFLRRSGRPVKAAMLPAERARTPGVGS